MAATVLNSPRAVEMSVYVVRAFVKLRELLASNTELARKLEALEKSVETLDARTRKQFEEVYRAIRALMAPPKEQAVEGLVHALRAGGLVRFQTPSAPRPGIPPARGRSHRLGVRWTGFLRRQTVPARRRRDH